VTRATLYAIPGSHPSAAVGAALDAKGIDYRRIDLIPALSRVWLRALRFPAGTVPALRVDGRRISGSRAIIHLVGVAAGDAEIEEWGDETFQRVARRIALRGLARSRAGTMSLLAETPLTPPLPRVLVMLFAPAILRLDGLLHGVTARAVRLDLDGLSAMLDRIDAWLESGRIGSGEPTGADYQLAGSLRLLLVFDDLAPFFEGRPCVAFAARVIPRFPGRVPPGVVPV
jgi:glutathione S-transferase